MSQSPLLSALAWDTGRWYANAVFEREIYTEIDIDAPPSKIWEVLADLPSWSDWNRVVLGVELSGPLAEGSKGRLSLNLGGPIGVQKLTVRLVTVRENEELAWQGGPSFIMSGCHRFSLRPNGDGTRFVHTEVFSGPLAPPLIGLASGMLNKGYRSFNTGLKKRCES